MLFPSKTDSPNGVRSIIADQQRTVWCRRDTDGPAPYVPVREYEPCEEVFILSRSMAGLMQRYPNHFVTRAHRFIPRPVLGGKDVTTIFRWELVGLVERQLQ